MSDLALQGKSALVTGGSRRIGRAIALALADAGADVTITYRSSRPDADETVQDIQKLGRRAQALECDVRSEAAVRDAVSAAVGLHSRLDILVNNAAVFTVVPFDEITLEQWDAAFETNARGPFLVSREALPHLRASHGRVINIGSLGAQRAWAGHAHYCASKAALHMLTQAMARALAPHIAVNCVAPGWIDLGASSDTAAERFAARTPMGRNGSARDVADAVLFFAANASFITGQILTVDGGLGL
ncbi:MAG TPA: SDR family NAD(P)-dependent oxidoreductase [Terracidiphilus sp.]|nr:SDR family NAD(P)-dependent oxidoreductase [Terracidiphilus sp.]